jgi:orotate phosphoribosyltransferase
MDSDLRSEVVRLLPFRKGHFVLESGHHGDSWLDLELLCLLPAPVRRLAAELASRLEKHRVEVVCGPLIEGAFVALMVAELLKVPFTYAERRPRDVDVDLFPFTYRLPSGCRRLVAGKRVALVNDVINAGSAVRGTLGDLQAAGAIPVVVGTLATLGEPASQLAARYQLALERLVALDNEIWSPSECPLCAQNIPVSDSGSVSQTDARP